jgi:hypothetical protein
MASTTKAKVTLIIEGWDEIGKKAGNCINAATLRHVSCGSGVSACRLLVTSGAFSQVGF